MRIGRSPYLSSQGRTVHNQHRVAWCGDGKAFSCPGSVSGFHWFGVPGSGNGAFLKMLLFFLLLDVHTRLESGQSLNLLPRVEFCFFDFLPQKQLFALSPPLSPAQEFFFFSCWTEVSKQVYAFLQWQLLFLNHTGGLFLMSDSAQNCSCCLVTSMESSEIECKIPGVLGS